MSSGAAPSARTRAQVPDARRGQQGQALGPALGRALGVGRRRPGQPGEGQFGVGLDDAVLQVGAHGPVEFGHLGDQVVGLHRQRPPGGGAGPFGGFAERPGAEHRPGGGGEHRGPAGPEQAARLGVAGPGRGGRQAHRHVDRHRGQGVVRHLGEHRGDRRHDGQAQARPGRAWRPPSRSGTRRRRRPWGRSPFEAQRRRAVGDRQRARHTQQVEGVARRCRDPSA